MEKIIVATRNTHKMTELKSLFSPYITDKYELASLDDIGFDGDIDECADSFIENAFIKAETVAKKLNCITFADDSGLEVDALDGAPGVHSARYAGYHAADDTNLQKLLFEMRDINDGARNAQFVSAFVAVFPDGRKISAIGICKGEITREKRGSGDFGYDPIFYYPPLKKTFAEMTSAQKNAVSHRAKAVQAFIKKFF